MERNSPGQFARIARYVRSGRWDALSGLWVECDVNLPSGESLIRQALHGQRFLSRALGIRATGAWLPDSFGYPGSLPQILRGASMETAYLQKLSTNANRLPHNSFMWEGIDGTQVLAHVPPIRRPPRDLSIADLMHRALAHQDTAQSDRSVLPVGYNDGGGGPTPQMLDQIECVRRFLRSPEVQWDRPHEFFEQVRAEYSQIPAWRGELTLSVIAGVTRVSSR
jgi:alpha-mannosidase